MIMTTKQSLCILFGLLISCAANGNDDFVNPTDLFNFDPVNIRMKNQIPDHVGKKESLKEESLTQKDGIHSEESSANIGTPVFKENGQGSKEDNIVNVETNKQCPEMKDLALKPVFKRYIMSLVHHIENKIESSAVPVDFCMKMQASYDDLLLLKHYGTGSSDNVHEVLDKLDRMFLYVTELPQEGTIFWLEKKLGLSTPNLLLITAVLLLGLISTKVLSKLQITRSFIAKGILFAFLFSTTTTFIELYQQKVADQEKILTEQVTERCPHLGDGMLSRVKFYILSTFTFQDENCREYYEAVVVNPLFKVSILEAGSIAFVKTLVSPLKIIGHGLKDFIVGFFKDLPVQYAFYSVFIIVMLLVILPFLAFGYTIRIPFLLTLQPPSSPRIEAVQDSKQVACLEYEYQTALQQLTGAQREINTLQQEVLMLKLKEEESVDLRLRALEAAKQVSQKVLEGPRAIKESSPAANKPELEETRSTISSVHTSAVTNKISTPGPEDLQLGKSERLLSKSGTEDLQPSKSGTEDLQLSKSGTEDLQLSKSERLLSKSGTEDLQLSKSERQLNISGTVECGALNGRSESPEKLTSPFVPFTFQEQEMLISGHISPVPTMIMVHGEGAEEPNKHVKESSSDFVDLAVSSTPTKACGERNALSNADFFLTQEER